MRRLHLGLLGLASLVWIPAVTCTVSGQEPQQVQVQQNLQIQGQIMRTAPDLFVVKTRDNKEFNVHINPQTKYLMDNKAILYSELRTGASITTTYVVQGDRYIANDVVVLPASAAAPARPAPVQPAPAQQVKVVPLQGEVIRVIGTDQIVIRTPDNQEMTVWVSPETKWQLTAKGGQLTDLKPGATIGVQYDLQDKRHMARQVQSLTRVEGQIVRVVGKDQVVIRTSDGKEVVVFVSPETRYMLSAQGGQLTDLRPGADINIYYDINDRRFNARTIFPRRR